MVQNALLRANARKQLDENIFKSKWLMMTLVCALLPLAEAAAVSLFVFGVIAVIIISGPLLYGVARVTVECVENEKWDVSHAFVAFQENFGHSAMLGFLQMLLTFLWSLLFIVPGIVKSYSYAMTYFIMNDDETIGANDAITKSREMMNGHKWELFMLDLSFFGWILLSILTFGILSFWVTPYMNLAHAEVYRRLKGESDVVTEVLNADIAPTSEW
jgi:uncharacterized membrane protein